MLFRSITFQVPQMLYLECDPIPEAVENEDDLDYVPVTGHEEGKF